MKAIDKLDKIARENNLSANEKSCLFAYADSALIDFDFDETKKIRNLDFKCSEPMSGDRYKLVMNLCVPDAYNEFDSDKIDMIVKYYESAKYYIAREGSVCVYIGSCKQLPPDGAFYADEISIEGKQQRIWWD